MYAAIFLFTMSVELIFFVLRGVYVSECVREEVPWLESEGSLIGESKEGCYGGYEGIDDDGFMEEEVDVGYLSMLGC